MERRESGDKLIGRDYFIEILGEGSQDFVELEKLVEDSDGKISWENLQQFTRIESGMVEGIYRDRYLDLRGTRVNNLWKFKSVGGYLDLRGTRVKSLESLKSVGEGLDCESLDCLENLGELEKVGGFLILSGTKVSSFGKLNSVGGYLYCGGLYCLEDLGSLEYVGGYFCLIGTKIELQFEVMDCIKSGKLRGLSKVNYDDNIDLLNPQEILKGEVSLFGEIRSMEWVRLFMDKLGEYIENEDEKLRVIRVFVGNVMMGKYDKSIKEYLEKDKDKLNQEMVDSIGKDLSEKKKLFKNLFGEKLVEEIFRN